MDYKEIYRKCPEHARRVTLSRWACRHGRLDILKELDQKYDIVDKKLGLLVEASRRGHIDIVEYLLEKGCQPSWSGHKSVFYSIKYNHFDVFLLVCPKLTNWEEYGYWHYSRVIFNRNRLRTDIFKQACLSKNSKFVKYLINDLGMNISCIPNFNEIVDIFNKSNPYIQTIIVNHATLPKYISSHQKNAYTYMTACKNLNNILGFFNGRCKNKYMMANILGLMSTTKKYSYRNNKIFKPHEIFSLIN